ncbi:MAG: uncharacterized protein PWP15_29 [Methanothermococcus sp.]|jgi:hypothetical protein|uniref:RNA-binding domain-containing protein n=1 Tax=Methanothermococcus TaxID=155862 RepID=UPI00035D80C9|nr:MULTISPECIES: RNA-binding domain-containing protein [Methanothermococcus]MDK2789522.1 uncharacterized protein [Methanothermococcus sp.]
MIIKIKTRIKPTEDIEKIKKAMVNIFPDVKIAIEEDEKYILGEATDISRFKELIRSQAILDTARMILEKGIRKKHSEPYLTTFKINKQAAFVNNLNFDEDIHGGMKIKIIAEEGEDLMKIIKDIAPRTKNGVIVDEDELEEQ